MKDGLSICVYCGASPGSNPQYQEIAEALGTQIAKADGRLVYGAGTRGIMGAVARGAMNEGGRILGVIPQFLIEREANAKDLEKLSELQVTQDMHERKSIMFSQSDAFVALPGGVGTLEEIVEIMTWAQLGRHAKPIVFCNVNGFWSPLLELLGHMMESGFIHTDDLLRPIVVDGPNEVLPAIVAALKNGNERSGDQAVLAKL